MSPYEIVLLMNITRGILFSMSFGNLQAGLRFGLTFGLLGGMLSVAGAHDPKPTPSQSQGTVSRSGKFTPAQAMLPTNGNPATNVAEWQAALKLAAKLEQTG